MIIFFLLFYTKLLKIWSNHFPSSSSVQAFLILFFSCPSSSLPTLRTYWFTIHAIQISDGSRRKCAHIWSDNCQLLYTSKLEVQGQTGQTVDIFHNFCDVLWHAGICAIFCIARVCVFGSFILFWDCIASASWQTALGEVGSTVKRFKCWRKIGLFWITWKLQQ